MMGLSKKQELTKQNMIGSYKEKQRQQKTKHNRVLQKKIQ